MKVVSVFMFGFVMGAAFIFAIQVIAMAMLDSAFKKCAVIKKGAKKE